MVDREKTLINFLTDSNLKLILNNLDEGIHIVDQEGRTIFYNQKVSDIDGLEPAEVLGKNIFDTYPSLTVETSTLIQTLKTGQAVNNKQQTFINSKGEKITTINQTVPLQFDNGEKGAMEVSRDITQLEELVNDLNSLRSNLSNKYSKSKIANSYNNNTNYSFNDIIGDSPLMNSVIHDALRAAGSDSSVLLVGETGTGKELFAQSIHNASKRREKPFIAQNCAALPKDLLEGLLFGTEKGGFTGAKDRPGLFEQAQGGTILLDEINSMDLALQAKLLRVLQENKVRRIGGRDEININVRVIATMNMDPDNAFKERKLREDLFYRLSVVYLKIPPLRKRKKDIPKLVDHFINIYNKKFSRNIKGIDNELTNIFQTYDWPGNVRELQHIIENAFNMLQRGEMIDFNCLSGYVKERLESSLNSMDNVIFTMTHNKLPSLNDFLEKIEKMLITRAMDNYDGNISAAARSLDISRQSLQYKLKKHLS